MVRTAILASALICVLIGLSFLGRDGLAMGVTSTGEILYPQSSGSGDAMILGLGLVAFMATLWLSLRPNRPLRTLAWAYCANLALLIFVAFLVSLDSSFLVAAESGDTMPLASLVVACVPIPVWLASLLAAKWARTG